MKASKSEPITKVLFRWWKKSVIAIFIEEPGTINHVTCDSYQHVGQHGACDPSIINNSRPATEEEYTDLKRELESYPHYYNLRILKRSPNGAIDETRTTQATS